MQQPDPSGPSGLPAPGQADGGFWEYFEIISKYRRFIGYTVGAAFMVSLVISFLIPKTYMASARILAPQESGQGLASLIAGADDSLVGLAAALNGKPTPATLFVGILKSRSVADAMNEKFDLKALYNARYVEDVYAELADHSIIEASKRDPLITIAVKDRDPKRAADMANAYVDILNRLNRRLSTTQGKRKRIFLEGRLKEIRADLERSESDLKAFQEKYHLVAVEVQAKAVIEGAAEIKGQIVAAQTELEVYKQFGTEKQVEAVMLKARIEELQKQLRALEQGEPRATGGSGASKAGNPSGFSIPFDDLPRLSMELMRLTREAKVQEKLFALITAQYEMAQIEEARDVDTVQVLDPAAVPQKKFGPRRRAIVAASTALALMVSVFVAFLIEYTGGWYAIGARWPKIAHRLRNLGAALKFRK
jgi:tyrosine-protein kinase Etk/Wzc